MLFYGKPVFAIAFALATTFILNPSLSNADDACYPAVDLKQPQYFIGYGSLMKESGKRKDGASTGFNLPVYVKGFQREWSAKGPNVGMTLAATYLGVSVKQEAEMAAAIFRVFNAEDVKALDKREFFYCRHPVEPKQITMTDGTPLPEAQYWIYVIRPEYHHPPTAAYPISQFYVDIFLEGCIEIEEKFKLDAFLEACIETTTFWSEHWVNDRLHPRSAPIAKPNTLKIDKALQKVIPEQFKARRIE